MSEIIWGIDASYQPIKRVCKEQEIMCELATEFGYCKITGCVHRTIHYGAKMDEVEKDEERRDEINRQRLTYRTYAKGI